jgi:hypothetical protein
VTLRRRGLPPAKYKGEETKGIRYDKMDNPYRPSEPELFLSIRFSASLPDVLLEISSPTTTTTAGLKRLIRTRLPAELSTHRLRLIHAGKALEDSTPLSTSLKLNSFPPPPKNDTTQPPYTAAGSPQSPAIIADDYEGEYRRKEDLKGKTPIRNEPHPRIYIHCSIGDVSLSAADLDAEASIASTTSAKSRNTKSSNSNQPTDTQSHNQQHHDQPPTSTHTTTTPAPHGFDRLLSSGFTETEISALRAQFLNMHSLTRTPDTMPSSAELRVMEERWLDNSDPQGSLGGGVVGGGGDDGGAGSPLDDMLWGCVMGFFWPVGCSVWLLREDGVWSWRKGLAVFVGVCINLLLGTVRMIG